VTDGPGDRVHLGSIGFRHAQLRFFVGEALQTMLKLHQREAG
jgi:hypothetical protein